MVFLLYPILIAYIVVPFLYLPLSLSLLFEILFNNGTRCVCTFSFTTFQNLPFFILYLSFFPSTSQLKTVRIHFMLFVNFVLEILSCIENNHISDEVRIKFGIFPRTISSLSLSISCSRYVSTKNFACIYWHSHTVTQTAKNRKREGEKK